MANFHKFLSTVETITKKNLENFIGHAKYDLTLWSDLPNFKWDSPVWPTHHRRVKFLKFGVFSKKGKDSEISESDLLPNFFVDFAKAYLRYSQSRRKTTSIPILISTLQALAQAITESNALAPCITKITEVDLFRTCEILSSRYGPCQNFGISLVKTIEDLCLLNIISENLRFWNHPFKGDDSDESNCKKNQSKLPDDDALFALAEIFANGYSIEQDDVDKFVTCTTCILLSSPKRIGEIIYMRPDFLRPEIDSLGNPQTYAIYWSPKQGAFIKKPILTIMRECAQEAVKRLTETTEEGRKLAKYFESKPTKFYRHEHCPNVPDDQELTPAEVVQALGLKSLDSTNLFKKYAGTHSLKGWTLNSLWQLVLKRHADINPHFPYQAPPNKDGTSQLKMSESLMCFRYRQLSYDTTSPVLLAPTRAHHYTVRVRQKTYKSKAKGGGKDFSMSIFYKHGYEDTKLRSHQLRHFLTTVGYEGGLDLEILTTWAARASITQTRNYIHDDPVRRAEKIAKSLFPDTGSSPKEPVTVVEYELREKGPVIFTRYGVCSHDWTLTPCEKFSDCLNCSELLMCKGHRPSIEAIQNERDMVAENYHAAEAKILAGEAVATRWFEAHTRSLYRMDKILETMQDPSIEDGSIIQMKGKDFTMAKRILNKNKKQASADLLDPAKSRIPFSPNLIECLNILRDEKNA